MTDKCVSHSYRAFIATADDATKAKYAAEMEHANGEWQKPLGALERRVTTLYTGPHVCGSRIEFRRAA